MGTSRREGPTMGGTDTREPDMSLTEQATQTDARVRPGRRSGERLVIAVSVLLTLFAIVGIAYLVLGSDEPTAPPPAPAAVEEPAEPDPAEPPVQQTPEDLAAAAAQERYREFLDVRAAVAQGGYKSSAPFDAVTVAPERVFQETAFRNAQETPGLRQIGTTQIASMSVTSVDLTPEPGGYPEVVLQVCLDVSGVDIVDGSGNSIVSQDREDRSKSTVTLYQYEPGTKGAETGGWYVYEATALNEPC
jgi:hypothetical protein